MMTETILNPYTILPPRAFWRTGVAETGVFGLASLWQSRWTLPEDAQFATFGSCFAQHISRALRARRMGWVDAEPPPHGTPPALVTAFNYRVFSARTANVYTAAQLRLLLQMAVGQVPLGAAEIWAEPNGRFRDSLRPMIEPEGFASYDEALLSRQAMLRALKRAVTGADVFVFTLGLTEGWENAEGQPYAACPGTLGGSFDPQRHRFVNYRHAAVRAALDESLAILRALNPAIHLLLTVSPVPLTATASGHHVLTATTYSKSVLRAVAGEMQQDDARVDYFPSYEIITGPPTRGAFYAPNLRSVESHGVDFVMQHFFGGLNLTGPRRHEQDNAAEQARELAMTAELNADAVVCEEAMLEHFNAC